MNFIRRAENVSHRSISFTPIVASNWFSFIQLITNAQQVIIIIKFLNHNFMGLKNTVISKLGIEI